MQTKTKYRNLVQTQKQSFKNIPDKTRNAGKHII